MENQKLWYSNNASQIKKKKCTKIYLNEKILLTILCVCLIR